MDRLIVFTLKLIIHRSGIV